MNVDYNFEDDLKVRAFLAGANLGNLC